MRLRSLLFVPGDSARKFAKACGIGADVLILNLEDSIAPSKKLEARAIVAALPDAQEARDWRCFGRVNPFDIGLTFEDLAAANGAMGNKEDNGNGHSPIRSRAQYRNQAGIARSPVICRTLRARSRRPSPHWA